jgi:hypothetical protein
VIGRTRAPFDRYLARHDVTETFNIRVALLRKLEKTLLDLRPASVLGSRRAHAQECARRRWLGRGGRKAPLEVTVGGRSVHCRHDRQPCLLLLYCRRHHQLQLLAHTRGTPRANAGFAQSCCEEPFVTICSPRTPEQPRPSSQATRLPSGCLPVFKKEHARHRVGARCSAVLNRQTPRREVCLWATAVFRDEHLIKLNPIKNCYPSFGLHLTEWLFAAV